MKEVLIQQIMKGINKAPCIQQNVVLLKQKNKLLCLKSVVRCKFIFLSDPDLTLGKPRIFLI